MTYQRLWGNRRKYDIRVGFIERIEVGLEKVWLVHVAPVLEMYIYYINLHRHM